jgi:hypothetical protein
MTGFLINDQLLPILSIKMPAIPVSPYLYGGRGKKRNENPIEGRKTPVICQGYAALVL